MLLERGARSITAKLVDSVVGPPNDILDRFVDAADILRDRGFGARSSCSGIAYCVDERLDGSDEKRGRILKVILSAS